MRKIIMELYQDGSVKLLTPDLYFNNEDETVEVEVIYPEAYQDWDKVVEIKAGTIETFKTDRFTLSSSIMKNKEIRFQPTATLNDKVQKWNIRTVILEDSLNVIDDNDTIDESVARELLNKIENHGQEVRDEIGIKNSPNWQQIIDFIKEI
jgi:hypothetical protein